VEPLITETKNKLADFRKVNGSHYTPELLAGFVAKQVIEAAKDQFSDSIKILDPAVGDGELLISLLSELASSACQKVYVTGFDTNPEAINTGFARIKNLFPNIAPDLSCDNFVDISQNYDLENNLSPFAPQKFDLVIANPPYVRTQVLGANKARQLANTFELAGRIDLYHVFIRGIAAVLRPGGIAGIIVSNRFMTTKAGLEIRKIIKKNFEILHLWDLGDTRLFDAAVLPAVLLLKKKNITDNQKTTPKFTSIYSTGETISEHDCENVIAALDKEGVVKVKNDNYYLVRQGKLDLEKNAGSVWSMATDTSDKWLLTVQANTFCTFGDVGKIRVGVKTTADKVFIRDDWDSLPVSQQPELLKPLITHHIARRYKSHSTNRKILYTHYIKDGKRAVVNLRDFPRSKTYLNKHKTVLKAREYISQGGRNWFEIWVPQNPALWSKPKIVFRDITAAPTFWMDLDGAVVNGDCYWLTDDFKKDENLLWLCLAVGNSSFIEVFYDHSFNNKLYAGRRRFMTQYVEKFPLPEPASAVAKKIIKKTKSLYNLLPSADSERLEKEINKLVWESFGFSFEEISW
jgi:adenine-specific DNA-methyltransferase